MPISEQNNDWRPQPSAMKEQLAFQARLLSRIMAGEPILPGTETIELPNIVGALIEYVERLEARVAKLETSGHERKEGRYVCTAYEEITFDGNEE